MINNLPGENKLSNNTNGCSCNSGCCISEQQKNIIEIDFLYLDLTTCERCQGAESNLDQAITTVSALLESAGYEVKVKKINITTPELAIQYEFLSSPTIRINSKDIALDVTETTCNDCGDICGDSVDCRSWVYQGVEYSEPPKEMIVNAIMKEIYGGNSDLNHKGSDYVLPQNLKAFFDGIEAKKNSY